MERQKELGGARALLQLGTDEAKDSKPEDGIATEKSHHQKSTDLNALTKHISDGEAAKDGHVVPEFLDKADQSLNNTDVLSGANHSMNTNSMDTNSMDTNSLSNTNSLNDTNQSLNDAVEAAVMRYVGGTLETGESLEAGNGESSSEAHELQKRRIHHEDLMTEYQWDKFLQDEVAAGFERTPTKRARRKSFSNSNEIDPELADLDTADHDQLVHAAIMGAGELAKQLSISSQNRHQMPMLSDRPEEEAKTSKNRADSAIKKRVLKKQPEAAALMPKSKYNHTSIGALIEQASNEACMWYNIQADSQAGGPRLFSRVEIDIVENFIQGYCQINNLTRNDICRRVWAADRPKDNFWECLSKVLPYRSRASVYKHIRRQYHVFEIRAKWTKAEDELLKKLAEMSTLNWKQIGATMNRMPEDCRDRWRNYIKCGENRVAYAWSEAEETSLRNIVMDMITKEQSDKPIKINWTLVSERMNGVRSRIQCRYKWNKLLKRESLARIAVMDTSTKLWLLNQISEMNVPDADSIDWDYVVHMYHETHKEKGKILWTAGDFKVAFDKLKRAVRDKNISLHSLLAKLISSLYEAPKEQYEEIRSKNPNLKAEEEAASVANAAVAAVSSGVNSHDAQPQEYSLWR